MLRSRRFHASLLGVITSLTITADTVLSVLVAISLSSRGLTFIALPIAASVCNIAALGCVMLFAAQYAWKKDRNVNQSTTFHRAAVFGCVSVMILSRTVSLGSVVVIKRRIGEAGARVTAGVISDWDNYFLGHLTVWAVSCLTTIALLTTPRWNRPTKSMLLAIPYSERDSDMAEAQDFRKTTINYHVLQTVGPSSPSYSATSPIVADRSSQSTISWRDSLKYSVRPSSSRSKLISRPSFSRDSSRSIYSEDTNVSQSDGFESWDLSTASLPIVAPALMAAPRRGTCTTLETIPGSRPSSPARPLDGPFPLSDETDAEPLSPPPKLVHDVSRPPSPAVSESHIHPLFRTESPIPPPEGTFHPSHQSSSALLTTRSHSRNQRCRISLRQQDDRIPSRLLQPHALKQPCQQPRLEPSATSEPLRYLTNGHSYPAPAIAKSIAAPEPGHYTAFARFCPARVIAE